MKLFFLYTAALQLTILLLCNSIDTFLLLTTGDIHNCLLQEYKLGIFRFSGLPSGCVDLISETTKRSSGFYLWSFDWSLP